MTTAIDVFEAKRQKTEAAFATYHLLRMTLHAAKTKPQQKSVEEIDAILTAAQKTWDDLKSDSARAQRREALKKQLEEVEKSKLEISFLQGKILEEKEAFEQLKIEHKRRLRPFFEGIADHEAVVVAAASIPNQLHQTRWTENDPGLLLRLEIERLTREKTDASRSLTNATARATQSGSQAERSLWRERIDVATAREKKVAEALTAAVNERTRLQFESDHA